MCDIIVHVEREIRPWLVAHDLTVCDADEPLVPLRDAAVVIASGYDAAERQRIGVDTGTAVTLTAISQLWKSRALPSSLDP